MKSFSNLPIRLALVTVFLMCGCATQPPIKQEPTAAPIQNGPDSTATTMTIGDLSVKPKAILLDHKYFQVFYDPKFRLAKYVKYVATAERLKQNKAKRANKFFPDPMLKEMGLDPVQKKEYLHTGYDQGHMAPSGDFTWDQKVNDETFVLSNMAPQKPNLNRDAWRRLEARVRAWGCGEGRVIVITGPILEDGLKKLKGTLPVPNEFFKIVIDDTAPRKVVAFVYNQSDKGDIYKERTVDVKKLEERIHESFESEVPAEDRNIFAQPAQLSSWREAKCE